MTLDELELLISTTRSLKDLFSPDPDQVLIEFRRIAHPDRNIGDPRAEIIFKKVTDLFNQLNNPVLLKSPKRTYEILKLLHIGDIADVHDAVFDTYDYLVKISRLPDAHQMLINEEKKLKKLLSEAGTTSYAAYLPALAESFPAIQGGQQKHVNVFVRQHGLYPLTAIKEQHPHLDPRHLIWIFKRLLSILGFIHRHEIIHGAVLPQHILVNADNHGLVLVGWGHSEYQGAIVKTISNSYRNWYPPEILNKRPVTSATDIFLAAKCILGLAERPGRVKKANQVPVPLLRFLKSCILEGQAMRPVDAWQLHEELDKVAEEIYGPPKFVPLVMS